MRRAVIVGAVGGLAAYALAIAGITSAIVSGSDEIPGNHIGAGHLSVEVNHGQGSDLDFAGLMPGEHWTGDQLITGDLAGVATADLSLTLSSPQSGPLPDEMSLTVWYGEPVSAAMITQAGQTCTEPRGFQHHVDFATLTAVDADHPLALGTFTPTTDGLCVRFEVGLDASASNAVQGADLSMSLGYTLTQTSAAGP